MVLKLSSLGGGSSIGFNIDIGISGYSTTALGQTYPAGGYSITSQLSDTSMDIYAIAADGTLAGYTGTKALTTSKDFDTIVIFGATNNDLLTFEYKSTLAPSSSGNEVAASPYITSVSVSNLVDVDDTTVVTGGNFATNVQAYFIGSDNVERTAKSVVRSNINELIVTRPDSLPVEYSPYSIKLVNSGINVASSTNPHILSNSISAGSSPTWNTTSMDTVMYNNLYSFSLSATDPDAGSISYSIVSGSLPTGLSLNSSTGNVSGTPSDASEFGVTNSITFRALDTGNNYLDKQLSLILSPVHDFALDFENNINNKGSSSNSITLLNTSYNSSIKKFGNYGLNLNGTSSAMTVTTTANQDTHTTAMWIYPRGHNTAGRSYIVDYRSNSVNSTPYGYWVFDSNNTATFGGNSEYTFSFNPTFNSWQHWAFVNNGTTAKWYINGSLIASASRVVRTTTDMTVGCFFAKNTGTSNYWLNAVIDNFVFVYRELSSSEIQDLYNSTNGF